MRRAIARTWPVHLLGHSLGGLVIQRTFDMGLLPANHFGGDQCRVIFMGTPARGSQSARALARFGPTRQLMGQIGGSFLHQGGAPRWAFPAQLGIIAGTSPRGLGRLLGPFSGPNDGTVAVAETRLEGATDYCELPVSHTALTVSATVARQIAAFLEHGRFNHNKS